MTAFDGWRGRGGRELVAGHDATPWPGCARPTARPRSLDGDPTTAWVTQFDDRPDARGAPRRTDRRRRRARIDVLTDRDRHPGLGVPTRLAVRTDAGEVRVDVPASGRVDVPLPGGPTGAVAVEVLETDDGAPGGGAHRARRRRPRRGHRARRRSSHRTTGPSRRTPCVLSGGLPGSDGCVQPEEDVVCYGEGGRDAEGGAVLARRFTAAGGGRLEAGGTLDVSRWATDPPGPGDARASPSTASSSRTPAPAARPEAVVDGDERTAWSPAAGRHLARRSP